jgi:hypothetical protein
VGKLAHLALLLSLLCKVAEVVLGVVPLLLGVDGLLCLLLLLFFLPLILFFLLLFHRCEHSDIDELIVAKEPFSAPWIPFEVDEGVSHWRVNDVRGVSEEVWRYKGPSSGNRLPPPGPVVAPMAWEFSGG